MNWFLIALVGPVLWSASNLIDKHILENRFKNLSSAAYYLFGGVAALFVALGAFILHPEVLSLAPWKAGLLLITSALGSAMMYCYLRAMRLGEASVVTSFFQLIPVLYLIFGYIFLHETLRPVELLGALIIVGAAAVLSLEMAEGELRMHAGVVGWMLLACLVVIPYGLSFKYVGVTAGYAPAVFWDFCGTVLVSLGIVILAPVSRRQFLEVLAGPKALVSLLFFNEAITLVGILSMDFATLLVPIAQAQVINGFQPLFVLLYGLVLARFFPRLNHESFLRRRLVQKLLAIATIIGGTVLINR